MAILVAAGLAVAVPALFLLPMLLPWRARFHWLLASHLLAELDVAHGPSRCSYRGATLVGIVEHPSGLVLTLAQPQGRPESLGQLVVGRQEEAVGVALGRWMSAGTPLLVAEFDDGMVSVQGPGASVHGLRWRGVGPRSALWSG